MQSKKENISKGDIQIQIGIIFIVCFFAFFINNHVIPASATEARNLATAQEMLRTGDYLVPTMNGELQLTPPPLPTWIAAGVEYVFPHSLVAQRCMSGLMATLMIFFLYLLTSNLTRNRNIGFLASLILVTSFGVVLMGRTAAWDIFCHGFMLGAIYFFVVGMREEGPRWKNFILAGIFFGLSFMSKGFVSLYVLFIPFLISFLLIYKPVMKGKGIPLAVMVLSCLAVSLWWPVYIYMFYGKVFLGVLFEDFVSMFEWSGRPWYYYWKFPTESGVWALFFITSIFYFFISKRREKKREFRFHVLWLALSLFLLSIVPDKKISYFMPILIPGSGVITFYIYRCFKGLKTWSEKFFFRFNAMLITLILAMIPILLYFMFYKEDIIPLYIVVLFAILSWGLCLYIFRCLFHKGKVQVLGTFGGIITCMVMIEAFCLIPIGHLFINENRHSIQDVRSNKDVAGLPFFYNQDEYLRIELVYEANRTILPLDVADSLFIHQSIPFVFVSGLPARDVFSGFDVRVETIGIFDNNWKHPHQRQYNMDLVREVSVIRPNK